MIHIFKQNMWIIIQIDVEWLGISGLKIENFQEF